MTPSQQLSPHQFDNIYYLQLSGYQLQQLQCLPRLHQAESYWFYLMWQLKGWISVQIKSMLYETKN